MVPSFRAQCVDADQVPSTFNSLQRFKQNMANTVISQQNQGLDTMNTDQVLDLFSAPAAGGSSSKPDKDGPMSRNEILAG